MFLQMLTWLAASASAAIAVVTIAGLLAPLDPRLEMINHFRPLWTAAAVAAFVIALMLRRRWLLGVSGITTIACTALMLAPLLFAAPSANGEKPTLRIVSLNLWAGNDELAKSTEFLLATKADVIVLQEVLCAPSDPLFEKLRATYPYIHRLNERCFGQAILSKYPITKTGREDYLHRRPIWLWADISLGGQNIRVTGVHLSHPTQPFDQVKNIDTLIAYAQNVRGPHVIAGDFNLTPYSWLLTKFARESGLKRGGTFQASWPGHRALPVFLIDHVFISADLARADFSVAGFAGSDHRPVIADIVIRADAIATSNPRRF